MKIPCSRSRKWRPGNEGIQAVFLPCSRWADKFYWNPDGRTFAVCQKCLGKKDAGGKFVRISRDEYIVRSVMES